VDAAGRSSAFGYGALGEQISAISGVGTLAAATTSDFYDGDGELTLSVDGGPYQKCHPGSCTANGGG